MDPRPAEEPPPRLQLWRERPGFDAASLAAMGFAPRLKPAAQDLSELRASLIARDTGPAQLDFLRGSKADYVKLHQARFADQKAAHPERPYGFRLEGSAPAVAFMLDSLRERLSQYGSEEEPKIWRQADHKRLGGRLFGRSSLIENLKVERQLLREVLSAVEKLGPGDAEYDELTVLSYYYHRAIRLSDEPRPRDATYWYITYSSDSKAKPPLDELADFRARVPPFTLAKSFFGSALRDTHHSIFNPDRLEYLVAPVVGRMTWKPLIENGVAIGLYNVTRGFRLADGFWFDCVSLQKHDVMIHHAIENEMREKFYAEFVGADALLEQLPHRQEQLLGDLLKEIRQIRDRELKESVINMAAWVTHERGFPFYPRSYLAWQDAYINNTKLPNSAGMNQRTSMKVSEYLLKARLWAIGEDKDLKVGKAIALDSMAVAWLGEFMARAAEDPFFRELESHRKSA